MIDAAGPACSYCGARLNPVFYFCLVCATPYKTIDNVVRPISAARTESDLIKEKAPKVWPVFWTYAVVVFMVALSHFLLFKGDRENLYSLILGDTLLVLVTLFFQITFWRSLVVQFKNPGFNSRWAWLGLLILPGCLLVNFLFGLMMTHLDPGIKTMGHELGGTGLGPAGLFIAICLVPGIAEEIAFRGLILHWLQTAIRPTRALLLSSALFAALHVNPVSLPYLFGLGCLFGWVKMRTRSLYPSMLLHILHNAVVIFLFPVLS